MNRFRSRVALAATTFALTAALAGCSASGAGSSVSSGSAVATASDSAGSKAKPAASGALPSAVADSRQKITTGTLTVTVSSPSSAAEDAMAIVDAVGGRIDSRDEGVSTGGSVTRDDTIDGNEGADWARMTVRIPSAKLERTIEKIRDLGTDSTVSVATQDVTAQAQDLDARITALRASVSRLVDMMSKATTTADLITIESALSERQENLESLEAQKRSTDDQVALSTITIRLQSAIPALAAVPGTFFTGLGDGWQALTAFVASALVVVGMILPWAAFVGLLGAVVSLIVWYRRRARLLTG